MKDIKKTTRIKKWIFCLILIIMPILFFSSIELVLMVAKIDFIMPIRIIISGTDWREYHMFNDENFVPDPYLFWRLRPSKFINSKGFIGPEFSLIKPRGVFRIFCLGDSNTMGSQDSSYPMALTEITRNKPISPIQFEVLNGGTSGYTSLQGYRLFAEIIKYKPDLVTICFGWNDTCYVKRAPDKNFKPVNRPTLYLERFMYKFKTYQFLKYICYTAKYSIFKRKYTSVLERRVSLDDYRANLVAMVSLANKGGIKLLFITRPCNLEREPWMRSFIKDTKTYNNVMRDVATSLKVDLIDGDDMFWGHPEYFFDSCHFNSVGHKLLAEEIYRHLSSYQSK